MRANTEMHHVGNFSCAPERSCARFLSAGARLRALPCKRALLCGPNQEFSSIFIFLRGVIWSFARLFCVFEKAAHGMQSGWCAGVRAAKFFTTKVTKTRRGHEEKPGLGGNAGERQFTAEIAEIAEIAEKSSWIGAQARRVAGAMLRAASGEACDGAVDHRKSRAFESR